MKKKADNFDDLDDFIYEQREDDFEEFDRLDQEKNTIPVKKKKYKKEDWDLSCDDEQVRMLDDEEEFDEEGQPRELDFER